MPRGSSLFSDFRRERVRRADLRNGLVPSRATGRRRLVDFRRGAAVQLHGRHGARVSWLHPAPGAGHGAHPLRIDCRARSRDRDPRHLIPLLLPIVQQVYVAIVGYGFGAVLLRAAVCALILTPPTMLMGATLPIDRPHAERGCAVGRHVYTANLAGGAAGHGARRLLPAARPRRVRRQRRRSRDQRCRRDRRALAVASHGALEPVGTSGTSGTARTPCAPAPYAPFAPYALYGAAALSGFTALGAEVVWTRQLSLLFGASVYTFSLILAVFLGGLAIGGSIGARAGAAIAGARGGARPRAAGAGGRHWRRRVVDRQRAAAVAADAIVSIRHPCLAGADVPSTPCAAPSRMLPATILWGASFPLTIAAAVDAVEMRQRTSRAINALNTVGALAGAIAAHAGRHPATRQSACRAAGARGCSGSHRRPRCCCRSGAQPPCSPYSAVGALVTAVAPCPRAGDPGPADRLRPLGQLVGLDQAISLSRGRRHRVGGGDRRCGGARAVSHRRQSRSLRHGRRHAPRADAGTRPGPDPSAVRARS